MRQIDSEVDRLLTLLRSKISERGFTQLDVQQALGWGRSYISQLVTRQKKIRFEQVLLILDVLRLDPARFFLELYAPHLLQAAAPAPPEDEARQRELRETAELTRGVAELLRRKRLITEAELEEAVEAARRE